MCRLAKQKSNKANLSSLYPGWRVILEKLINHKTLIPFLQPLSSPWVGVSASKIFATILLHSWFIDHVLKKLTFDLLTGSGAWGGGLKAIYLLLCCCILRFHFIWYATWPCSENVEFWPIDHIPRVVGRGGRGSADKIFATMLLHSWFPLIWYATGVWLGEG